MTAEDRAAVRDYYDRFGDAETERMTAIVAGRVCLEVHRRFLARFLRPGMRVLEVGATAAKEAVERRELLDVCEVSRVSRYATSSSTSSWRTARCCRTRSRRRRTRCRACYGSPHATTGVVSCSSR